jgi:hypothetical protein
LFLPKAEAGEGRAKRVRVATIAAVAAAASISAVVDGGVVVVVVVGFIDRNIH